MNCQRKKIIISPEEHGELEWILLANSTRLSMDTRQYPSGISPFGSMLSSEELSVHWTAMFLNDAEAAGSGICSLATSSSPTNMISAAAFLACSTGIFFCFWTPWISIYFFWQFFFRKGCFCPIFPPFGTALLLIWDIFAWSQHEQRNNPELSSQASLDFGNKYR